MSLNYQPHNEAIAAALASLRSEIAQALPWGESDHANLIKMLVTVQDLAVFFQTQMQGTAAAAKVPGE